MEGQTRAGGFGGPITGCIRTNRHPDQSPSAHAAPHTHAYARAETGHDVPHVLQRVPVQDLVLLPLAQTEPVDIRGVLAPFVHLLQLRDEGSEDLQVAAGT